MRPDRQASADDGAAVLSRGHCRGMAMSGVRERDGRSQRAGAPVFDFAAAKLRNPLMRPDIAAALDRSSP